MIPFRKGQARLAKSLYLTANTLLETLCKILWPGKRPHHTHRICLYRIGNIGDIACAIPAMAAIRRAYPAAHLTLLTSPGKNGMLGAKELFEGADWLDEIIIYHSDEINTKRKQWAFLKRLRKLRFDVWFELPNDLITFRTAIRNMAMAWLSGARWAYGWRINTIRWATQAQSEHLKFPNETERLLNILSETGVEISEVAFPLPLKLRHRERVDDLLKTYGLSEKPLIAIAPGAKRPLNRWPAERFSEVGHHAIKKGLGVVVLGGESETLLCQQIVDGMREGGISLAGRTSLLESCELLKRCRLLICNDSGVQHLAAAVGTPCVSLFSFRDFRGKWRPYGMQNTVLQKWVGCHTCFLETCPYDNHCIKLIGASEVKDLIDQRMKTS